MRTQNEIKSGNNIKCCAGIKRALRGELFIVSENDRELILRDFLKRSIELSCFGEGNFHLKNIHQKLMKSFDLNH
jgi:hypothetical protein